MKILVDADACPVISIVEHMESIRAENGIRMRISTACSWNGISARKCGAQNQNII